MIRARRSRIAVAAAVILAAGLFIHFHYFFNPLTFHKDEITYLPWSWYTRPLEIEYVILGPDGNRGRTVTDEREIRLLIAELKKGLHLPHGDVRWDHQTGTQWVHVMLVRGKDHADLMVANGAWDQGVLFVPIGKEPVPVALSDELKQLLQQRFSEAQ